MSTIIKTKNFDLSTIIRDYITKKVDKLYSFFDKSEIRKIEIVIEKKNYKDKTHIYKAQITIWLLGNTILRSEKEQSTAQAAIDVTIEKLEQQITRYKGRFKARLRKTRKKQKENEIIFEPMTKLEKEFDFSKDTIEIKRTKNFKVSPMFVEQAIEQMELLDHKFYIFVNQENNKLSVIYRRNTPDQEYGLLEPEY